MTTFTITIEREGKEVRPVQDLAQKITDAVWDLTDGPNAVEAHRKLNRRAITLTFTERTTP